MFFNRAENFMSALTPYTFLPYSVLKCVHWRLSVQKCFWKAVRKEIISASFLGI